MSKYQIVGNFMPWLSSFLPLLTKLIDKFPQSAFLSISEDIKYILLNLNYAIIDTKFFWSLASVYYLSFPLPLGDKCIQYSHFWRCISGYMVGNSVLWQWAIIRSSFMIHSAIISAQVLPLHSAIISDQVLRLLSAIISDQVLLLHSAIISDQVLLLHSAIISDQVFGSTQPLSVLVLRLYSAIIWDQVLLLHSAIILDQDLWLHSAIIRSS